MVVRKRGVILFIVGLFVLTALVSAHTAPITYTPEPNERLAISPDEVRIRFSERVEPVVSTIEVIGPSGTRVDSGHTVIDENDPRTFLVSVAGDEHGNYTVRWKTVSADDGHFSQGTYSFIVGTLQDTRETTTLFQIQHFTTLPEAGLIGIELIGQVLLVGVLVSLLFFKDIEKSLSEEHKKLFTKYCLRMSLVGTALIVGAISVYIVIKTLDLQQLHATSFFSMLGLFLDTVGGRYALYRALLGTLFLIGFLCIHKRISLTRILILALPVVGIVLARSRVSHAAASFVLPVFSTLVTSIHLLAKELWVGALFALILIALPFTRASAQSSLFIRFLRLTTLVLGIALMIGGVTGMYVIWLHLKDFSYLLSTSWGTRFLVVCVLGCMLLVLRLYNHGAALRASKTSTPDVRGVSTTHTIELCVGIALLFVTSFLIITTPPLMVEEYSFEQSVVDSGLRVTLAPHPYESGQFLLRVDDPLKQRLVYLDSMEVTLTPHDIGTSTQFTPVQRSAHSYIFSQDLLTEGTWDISVRASHALGEDVDATFTLEYPKNIVSSRVEQGHREWNSLAIVLIILGIGSVLLGFVLYKSGGVEGALLPFSFPGISLSRMWFVGILVSVVLLGLVAGIHQSGIESDFEKACEERNHFWIQSTPTKNGNVVSPNTVTGCTLNIGLYHFATQEEFEYFLRPVTGVANLTFASESIIAGVPTDFVVQITNLSGTPINDLTLEHERLLHILIVHEDLKEFQHIHTEDTSSLTSEMRGNARFPLTTTFPLPGRYLIIADYVVRAKQHTIPFYVDVEGTAQQLQEEVEESDGQHQTIGAYEVTFNTREERIVAGEPVRFEYTIEKNGLPVKDLEPYLGATMHIALVKDNLLSFVHWHGEIYLPGTQYFQGLVRNYVLYHSHFVPETFGPRVDTQVIFPKQGTYAVFGEFKHEGEIIVTKFFVEVE